MSTHTAHQGRFNLVAARGIFEKPQSLTDLLFNETDMLTYEKLADLQVVLVHSKFGVLEITLRRNPSYAADDVYGWLVEGDDNGDVWSLFYNGWLDCRGWELFVENGLMYRSEPPMASSLAPGTEFRGYPLTATKPETVNGRVILGMNGRAQVLVNGHRVSQTDASGWVIVEDE